MWYFKNQFVAKLKWRDVNPWTDFNKAENLTCRETFKIKLDRCKDLKKYVLLSIK